MKTKAKNTKQKRNLTKNDSKQLETLRKNKLKTRTSKYPILRLACPQAITQPKSKPSTHPPSLRPHQKAISSTSEQ